MDRLKFECALGGLLLGVGALMFMIGLSAGRGVATASPLEHSEHNHPRIILVSEEEKLIACYDCGVVWRVTAEWQHQAFEAILRHPKLPISCRCCWSPR